MWIWISLVPLAWCAAFLFVLGLCRAASNEPPSGSPDVWDMDVPWPGE